MKIIFWSGAIVCKSVFGTTAQKNWTSPKCFETRKRTRQKHKNWDWFYQPWKLYTDPNGLEVKSSSKTLWLFLTATDPTATEAAAVATTAAKRFRFLLDFSELIGPFFFQDIFNWFLRARNISLLGDDNIFTELPTN